MANLYFPQLSTGALVQYPVKRIKSVQTVSTQAEDGSVLTYFDPKGSVLTWQLEYTGITQAEVNQTSSVVRCLRGPFSSVHIHRSPGELAYGAVATRQRSTSDGEYLHEHRECTRGTFSNVFHTLRLYLLLFGRWRSKRQSECNVDSDSPRNRDRRANDTGGEELAADKQRRITGCRTAIHRSHTSAAGSESTSAKRNYKRNQRLRRFGPRKAECTRRRTGP